MIATDHQYDLRVRFDGDEITVPFRIHEGKDYQQGEPLDDVAKRIGADLFRHSIPGTTEVKVTVYPVLEPIWSLDGQPCLNDNDPCELIDVHVHRD